MSSRPELKLAWCSHEAAKYACEKWHYSGCIPKSKLVKIGVWENGAFIGAVIFGRGANNNIGSAYKLQQTEVCELVRVALTAHKTPVSRIGAIAVKMLKASQQGLRLIVSYADPAQNHHGGIYQAMNWLYAGELNVGPNFILNGSWVSGRSLFAKHRTASLSTLKKIYGSSVCISDDKRHKYLYPLDDAMREQIKPLAKPYPKLMRAK